MSAAADTSPVRTFLGKPSHRRLVLSVVAISIAIHLLAGLGAAIWIVARYFDRPKAEFISKKVITLPPKIIDPKLASAEFEAAASKPQLDQKIASLRPTDFALPDVPMAPVDEMMKFDPTANIESSIAGAGIGAGGAGDGGGAGGNGSGFSFFGIRATGSRIVIAIDISGSMVVGDGKSPADFERVEKEVAAALASLQPPTEFNLVAFGRAEDSFENRMQNANDFSKERGLKWLHGISPGEFLKRSSRSGPDKKKFDNTRHSGTRTDLALEKIFEFGPDIAVVLSDGEPYFRGGQILKLGNGRDVKDPGSLLKWVSEQQKKRDHPITIHTISYKGEGEQFMTALAKQNKGTFKLVK